MNDEVTPVSTKKEQNTVRWRRLLVAMWPWLIEPSPAIVGPETRQQVRLLMATLLVLLMVGTLGLLLSLIGAFSLPTDRPGVDAGYNWTVFWTVLLLGFGYRLSRTTHYRLAASVVVSTVLGASYLAVLLDPGNREILYFLALGGLVGGLFLSARATGLVFLITLVALLCLPAILPGYFTVSSLNALFFLLTVGALVVMAASLRENYLAQIDEQTRRLIESESRLRELSIRDPLTGLFNRRYLEEVLAQEIIRAARGHYPVGVIMADIDRFKSFNDRYGHAAGDAVLVQVGNLLRTLVRASDVSCRYGGEEFILLMPEASRKISLERAEQMREGVGLIHVEYEGRLIEAVTLSLGVAVFPEDGSTQEAILAEVDRALYRAKREGRNRVQAAG